MQRREIAKVNPPAGMWLRWKLALACVALACSPSAFAWSNHALCTWPALSVLPQLRNVPAVEVEPLEHFLAAQGPGLEKLLADEETWARAHVPRYPARPDSLAFKWGGAAPGELRRRFIAAVRINPNARLALFLQLQPGRDAAGATQLREQDVTAMKHSESTRADTFVALREGQQVPVIDVIATASDEPDYGMDIGLWADNGTPYGQRYGFGKQPFGNPAVENSSQAPLHIGYFHEPAIMYRAAPFLERTYPEYRIHLWRSLAAYALRTGHPYWGWRFAGWGLHYVQDLAQPYHARVVPGFGAWRMLWVNTLSLIGISGPKSRAITLVTNRHFALENFQLHLLWAGFLEPQQPNAGMQALRDASADPRVRYDDSTPRTKVSMEAYAAADAIDAALTASVPPRMVSDPSYVFGETEPNVDLYALLGAVPQRRTALTQAVAPLLRHAGSYSRAYVLGLVDATR